MKIKKLLVILLTGVLLFTGLPCGAAVDTPAPEKTLLSFAVELQALQNAYDPAEYEPDRTVSFTEAALLAGGTAGAPVPAEKPNAPAQTNARRS